MTKKYFITVGVLGVLVILFGAIGGHLLKSSLTTTHFEDYQTGIQYMMFHTLALLSLGFGHKLFSQKLLNVVYVFFLLGIIFFSFGIMIQATTEFTALGLGPFSFLIPTGGLLFIAGWTYIGYMGFSFKHTKSHKHKHRSKSSSSSSTGSSTD